MTKHLMLVTTALMVFAACAAIIPTSVRGPPQPLNVTVTTKPVDWTTVDFLELINRSRADCIVDGQRLVRCASPIVIDGLAKVSVIGHGVRVEFSDPRPGRGGIVLRNASEVSISNIELGWLDGGARDPILAGTPRIQSFGRVDACANSQAGGMLSLDVPIEGIHPVGAVTVWDDSTGWPWYRSAPSIPERYLPANSVSSFTKGRSSCIQQLAGLLGQRVLVRHLVYSNHAFRCGGCSNVTVEGLRVTSAPGMAFVFGDGGSNLTLRSNVVEPRCSPHCAKPEPSVTADAAHFAGVAGNILIEKNNFGWQGDDAINVTGLLIPARVLPADSEGPGRTVQLEDRSRPSARLLTVGSRVRLFDRGLSSLGEADILAVDLPQARFRLAKSLQGPNQILIVRSDMVPDKVVVRGNSFHDSRARGILMGGSNALVENNVITRVTMEAVLVAANTIEGPGAQHVLIRRNRMSDVNRYPAKGYPSAISVAVDPDPDYIGKLGVPIEDIAVEGNTFANVYTNASAPVFFGTGVRHGRVVN